jgi:hypothetical protein
VSAAVVAGMQPCLGDAKRAVRRQAVRCRNRWIALTTDDEAA